MKKHAATLLNTLQYFPTARVSRLLSKHTNALTIRPLLIHSALISDGAPTLPILQWHWMIWTICSFLALELKSFCWAEWLYFLIYLVNISPFRILSHLWSCSWLSFQSLVECIPLSFAPLVSRKRVLAQQPSHCIGFICFCDYLPWLHYRPHEGRKPAQISSILHSISQVIWSQILNVCCCTFIGMSERCPLCSASSNIVS